MSDTPIHPAEGYPRLGSPVKFRTVTAFLHPPCDTDSFRPRLTNFHKTDKSAVHRIAHIPAWDDDDADGESDV